MQTIELRHFGKARLWWATDPFDGSERPGSLTVELFLPRGPRSEYALLGASLVSQGHGVRVDCAEDLGPWHESLAGGLDDVRRGLPVEYRGSIPQQALRAAADRLTRCTLVFDCAAHGAVGSNPALFGQVAAIVATLLTAPTHPDESDVRKTFENAGSNPG